MVALRCQVHLQNPEGNVGAAPLPLFFEVFVSIESEACVSFCRGKL